MPGGDDQLGVERLEVAQVGREVLLGDGRHLDLQLDALEGAELVLQRRPERLPPGVVGDDGADPGQPSCWAYWAIGPATIGAAGRQVRNV